MLTWLSEALSQAGHEVITSSLATPELVSVQGRAVDVVLTDIYMPEHDGLEVIALLRRLAPRAKVMAMSSRPSERNMFAVAKALGAARTLQKPFSREQLLTALAGLLGSGSQALPVPAAPSGQLQTRSKSAAQPRHRP